MSIVKKTDLNRGRSEPLGALGCLRTAVRHLSVGRGSAKERLNKATFALTSLVPEQCPQNIRGRIANVHEARRAVREDDVDTSAPSTSTSSIGESNMHSWRTSSPFTRRAYSTLAKVTPVATTRLTRSVSALPATGERAASGPCRPHTLMIEGSHIA